MAKILIVDDEKSIRITLREFLEKEGYEISLTENGIDCLKKLKKESFDVIISDIILPEMNGIQLLQKIREISADIQVIMITGEPTVKTVTEALRAGATDYLQKPISGAEITKVVANAVRVKELVDERSRLKQINYNYQQKLEEMVGKRTFELQKSNKKLEREIVQKEQVQEELLLRDAALESAANAIVITDKNGTIIWVNKAFTELTGYSFDEAIGQNPRILNSGKQDDSFYKEMWDTISSGQVWHGEITNKRKNGTLYIEEMTITPVKNEKGAVSHFISIKDDVSERKKLESQFQQAQKMESIGTLAGGVAHDFNNLLTVINGYAELSLQKLDSTDPLFANIQAIKHAGEKAENMTRQLLAFSRKQIFQPKIIDLNMLIANQDKMLRRLIGENIKIETVLNPEAVNIKADPGQIEQIFMNLVINARDAINAKKQKTAAMKITIETGRTWLDDEFISTHHGSRRGMHVYFTVSDTGIGMDKETADKIFEPFFTTKAEGKGTGLGLSTVYGIVKQNNGSLYVYSEPGQGTSFKVFWPAAEESYASEAEIENDNKIPGGNELILLTEDDDGLRAFTTRALQNLGYTIYAAANGKLALELIKSKNLTYKINLLFTDIVMPDMGGIELADELNKIRPDLKVLYASGHTDEHIVKSGALQEGLNFIQKPFTITELANKVSDVLDGDGNK